MWLFITVIILLLPALYLFLIMPRPFKRADMKALCVDYAHRGLFCEEFPENSLGAFRNAVENGYGIELDVQLSRDKKIVVFHDYTLKRMCGAAGRISDYTYAELSKMKLLGTEYTIPSFVDVLRLVGGRVPLLIELKGEDTNAELCKLIAPILDKYKGAYSVESFNPFLLRWFKKNRNSVARGQLVTKINAKKDKKNPVLSFVLSNMLTNVFSRPDFIAVNGNIRNTPMVHICESIMQARVFVWTVKNEKEYVNCRKEHRRTIFEGFEPKKIERNR